MEPNSFITRIESYSEKEDRVYYKIVVSFKDDTWSVEKRYSEFDSL
jgi:hypothetical protein